MPPVPESAWVAGYWVEGAGGFSWVAGHWGRPTPRAETPPPSPGRGARWIAGTWIQNAGTWVWSPGFYDVAGRPPPPPRREQPGAAPVAGAVWLAGFWRWSPAQSRHDWVAGHWETPPGVGYEWVWDAAPIAGGGRTGRWLLRVDVRVDVRGGRR